MRKDEEYIQKQRKVHMGPRRGVDIKPIQSEVDQRKIRSVACPKCKAPPRAFCKNLRLPDVAEPLDSVHAERKKAFKIAQKRITP